MKEFKKFRFYFIPRLIKASIIAPNTAQNIVELGCGSGHKLSVIENFANKQSRILGIELDENRVKRAKRRVQDARIIKGDIRNLDSYISSANLIFMLKVAHQLSKSDLQMVLDKAFSVMSPGAHLVITNTFAPESDSNILNVQHLK